MLLIQFMHATTLNSLQHRSKMHSFDSHCKDSALYIAQLVAWISPLILLYNY